MSGDVQPRKRKDKKRKKDELGVEEPRGTAAALGEGDVFMHSHHEHATGGHWCAKIIFFSLLAILVTLIGLIILENRGLSELEANSVESRYSGVLEGWLEDAPDDDHHDEHTLELTHHDVEDDHDEEIDNANNDNHQNEGDASNESEQDFDHDEDLEDDKQEDDHEISEEDGDEENNDDDEENNEDDDDEDYQSDDGDDSQEQEQNYEDDDEELEREDDEEAYQADEGAENDDLQEIEENDNTDNLDEDDENEVYDAEGDDDNNEIDRNESEENYENEQQSDNEDEEEHEEEEEDDEEVEVEKLERENSEEEHEPISAELPALPEEDDDNEDDSDGKDSEADEDSGSDDEEFLEMDDPDEPPVERITVPAGKPFVEVEEEISSEQPPDTLEEEEEYEKRQEELRREEAQASHMWLKLGVGAALLVATHAVLRRATHSRDAPESEEHASREETPVVDRRMTLIAEEPPVPARRVEALSRPVVMEQVLEKMVPIVKSIPIRKQESEEEEEEREISEDEDEEVIIQKPDEKELYSEDEEIEEEEEEEIVEAKKETPKLSAPVLTKKPEPEPEEEIEDDPDVEIIGDEQLEEELEEEEDEEEISDVDDVELLTRLEAKYGRLPDPERAGQKQKDGGNSVDDLWPGEPSDAYWRQQLDSAEQELRQGSWSAAEARAAAPGLRGSARARYVVARSLDLQAEAKRDNRILTRAIQAYLELLKMNERLSDKKLLDITGRTLDRIQFRGNYLSAEPVYRLLIRRFPNEPAYRNNLTISFLMANRVDLAEETLKETLNRWPKDRLALAHYGFVLKTKHKKYEEAAEAFREALETDTGPANEARFYYHYGDSLLLLGRKEEAHEVHKRGAKLGHFLSPNQRSLYNVPRLKSSPWWDIEKTPYVKLARALERSWREILKEGEAAKELYEQEKEGLKERGEWSQMDLFVRGREVPGRCERARVTCGVVRAEPGATTCRRGQVKFSLMAAGTHVRAHVGPTNCRLRMHLGLSNTKDTYIRVDQEIRQWQEGKVLMFDDSFEHEVWHNGSGARLVLIVDVWHPRLSAAERAQLPAI